MRDTDVLRLRLQTALTCLSLAVASCGGEAKTPPKEKKQLKVSKKEDAKADEKGNAKAGVDPKGTSGNGPKAAGDGKGPEAAGMPPVVAHGSQEIKEGEFDYYGPPRDPYAEHDEEEGCPKGDWCGSPEDAAIFEVKGVEPVMSCPARIVANPQAEVKNKKAKKWKGFSFDGRMQGRLVTTTTEETRAKKKDDKLCCYHWFEYCSGRPLLDDDEQVLAALRDGDSWCSTPESVGGEAPALPRSLREQLAAEWLEDARMEHASIASFARATLELMALGAPPDILAGVQSAALDEVRHAGRCFALAARYSGRALEPAAVPALAPRPANFVQLACDTFIEGCVGETVAALMATRQARGCQDDAVTETLEMIADDEARHAALAWRTIEWAIAQGGTEVLEALRATAEQLRPSENGESAAGTHPALLAHGRLDGATRAQARSDAWREIIDPTLHALLAADLSVRC